VGTFTGRVGATALDLIAEGRQGVLAVLRGPGLRQGLARTVPELCTARPGLTLDAAREWLGTSFDLAVELARLRDGRYRVLRVAEVIGTDHGAVALRDIFTFSVERSAAGGAVEGSFAATGVVPRFVEELRLRGITLDQALFDRSR
jgi:pilus assembly protein CpaF